MKRIKLSLGQKTIMGIIIMILVLGSVLGTVTMVIFNKTIDSEYEKKVTNLAQTVGLSVDSDKVILVRDEVMEIFKSLDEKVGTENSDTPEYGEYISHFDVVKENPTYQKLQNHLNDIRLANDVDSIYIIYFE